MISKERVREFRGYLRLFERGLDLQNGVICCCGVTLAQCHTLMELDKEDNITLKDLSEKLFLDKSTLSRTIEGLVNQGLVERETPKSNRRTIMIRLTKQGISVCKKINSDNDKYYQDVLNSLSEEKIQMFFDSFNTIVFKMMEINKNK